MFAAVAVVALLSVGCLLLSNLDLGAIPGWSPATAAAAEIGTVPGWVPALSAAAAVASAIVAVYMAARYRVDGERRGLLLATTWGFASVGGLVLCVARPDGLAASGDVDGTAWLWIGVHLATLVGLLVSLTAPMRVHAAKWRPYGGLIAAGLAAGLLVLLAVLAYATPLPVIGLSGGGLTGATTAPWLLAADALLAVGILWMARIHAGAISWSAPAAVALVVSAVLLLDARPGELGWYAAGILALAAPLLALSGLVGEFSRVWRRMYHERLAMAEASSVDVLTGLAGRGAVMDAAAEQLALGYGSLLVLDVGGMDEINQTLGTSSGDAILAETAARLANGVRGADVVGRFGDDLFVVVLDCASSVAASVGDRLRLLVATPVDLGGEESVRVGASVGLAIAAGDLDAESWFARAADALHAAKSEGGDRLMIAAVPVPPSVHADDVERPTAPAEESPYGELVHDEATTDSSIRVTLVRGPIANNDASTTSLGLVRARRSAAGAVDVHDRVEDAECWAELVDVDGGVLWQTVVTDPWSVDEEGDYEFDLVVPDVVGAELWLSRRVDGDIETSRWTLDDVEETILEHPDAEGLEPSAPERRILLDEDRGEE